MEKPALDFTERVFQSLVKSEKVPSLLSEVLELSDRKDLFCRESKIFGPFERKLQCVENSIETVRDFFDILKGYLTFCNVESFLEVRIEDKLFVARKWKRLSQNNVEILDNLPFQIFASLFN